MLAYERLPSPHGGGGAPNEHNMPVVVAVHGMLSDRESMRPLCSSLSACARVYLVDLPGHGASELGLSGSHPLTMDSLARGLLHFIKQLQLRRCLLLGHSLGGQVCMCAALLASRDEGGAPGHDQEGDTQGREGEEGPQVDPRGIEKGGPPPEPLVAGVCAIDILPINYFETGQPLPRVAGGLDIVELLEALARLDLSKVSNKQEAVCLLQQQQPTLSVQEAEGALSLLQETPDVKPTPLRWRMAVGPLSEALKKKVLFWGAPQGGGPFDGPLLLIKGERSPWVSLSAVETKTKHLFPHSRVEVIPNAGHSPHRDFPQEVSRLVLTQLQHLA
ncbi:hypothetical protein ACSSS7_004573 [Eimeria intestinalis]